MIRYCVRWLYFTHKYGKIDRIESHTEYWLESDARIRTDFNIQGIKTDFIDKIKHKSLDEEEIYRGRGEGGAGRNSRHYCRGRKIYSKKRDIRLLPSRIMVWCGGYI